MLEPWENFEWVTSDTTEQLCRLLRVISAEACGLGGYDSPSVHNSSYQIQWHPVVIEKLVCQLYSTYNTDLLSAVVGYDSIQVNKHASAQAAHVLILDRILVQSDWLNYFTLFKKEINK